MANGLFATRNIGTPGEIQRLMQLEQEKRIRDAGAGFSNPLVRARAMAGQGMQEAISGIGTGLTGLLGGEGRIRMDPRMQEAVKRDRVRTTMMQKYKDAAADGVVTYEERMAIAADLDAAGFPNEAEKARASARSIKQESRAEKAEIRAESEQKRKEKLAPAQLAQIEAKTEQALATANYFRRRKDGAQKVLKPFTKSQKETLKSLINSNDAYMKMYKKMFPGDYTGFLGDVEKENIDILAGRLALINQTAGNTLNEEQLFLILSGGGLPSGETKKSKKGKGTVYPRPSGEQTKAGPVTPPSSPGRSGSMSGRRTGMGSNKSLKDALNLPRGESIDRRALRSQGR
jgi:hypothetical protein